MKACPKCSRYDRDAPVGGSAHHYIIEMERQRFWAIRGFDTYICPKCGFTEFYKWDVSPSALNSESKKELKE